MLLQKRIYILLIHSFCGNYIIKFCLDLFTYFNLDLQIAFDFDELVWVFK